MKTEILISCDDWENRVAVLEEGSLAEIYFEREEKVIGSIYKGRVENVLPGMGACFVNIGLGRNAFLYVDDIMRDPINIGETEITDRRRGHTVNELLKVGSDVLVQIVKEPRGLKGARVSTNVSLPGRYLVLMPTGRYSGVSSRIEDAHERERLKQIMRRVRPEGMATIVRTAAQGVSEAELIADLGVQLRLWHGILESYKRSTAPALLHKDLNLVFKAVRDFLTSDVTSVYIDSKEQYDEIRSTMSLLGPQYIDRLKLVEGPGTLFAQRGIDEELQKLLKPKIPLPSGGHLVLEHTEALTVIDVNTGKFTGGRNLEDTIVRTNIEAAAEIARQVRLRDIGGIIVVDFIDMTHERSREQVISTLTDALRRDRTRSTIQVFSNLGLLEFTRKRVGKDLAGQLRSDCPYCTGLGSVMSSETVAIGVLRQIRERIGRNGGIKKVDVVADPGVATQLEGWYRDEFEKLARDHDLDVALFVEPQRHREHVIVEESRRMRANPVVGSVVEAELLAVRLPNPASGVAEVNGYLIEVKDAANATGQTVKLRITAVEGNMVRAELAEPLPSAGRRRRGQRGRGKDIALTDAPIAPPAPSLRDVQVAEESRRHAAQETERRPSRLRRPDAVAFSVADDDDEAPRVATPAARGGQPAARGGQPVARAPKSRTESGRGDGRGDGRGGRRRPGARRGASSSHPPALVVGGEGDIDYDDGDDDAVITTPSTSVVRQPRPIEADADGADGLASRRRRRRGRGGKGRVGERPLGASAPADGDAEANYDEDDAVVTPRRSAAPIAGRDRTPAARSRAPYDEDESEDDMGAVVDPRQPGAGQRPAKRFGPVRQIYGRPVSLDETRTREERPPREERFAREGRPRDERPGRDDRPLREERSQRGERPARDERPPRDARSARDERPLREERGREDLRGRRPDGSAGQARPQRPPLERRPEDDEELDIVIKPKGPAAIHVDIRDDVTLRRRPAYEDRDRDEREPRDGDVHDRPERGVRPGRGDRGERSERGPRLDRGDRPERSERGPRPERGERGERRGPREGGSRFGGPSRGRAPAPKREGPTVKQLYPPPQEPGFDALGQERPDDGIPAPKKAGFGRQPRGPLMRPTDAPPVPKGKVRQLYPPPPEPAAGEVSQQEAPAFDRVVYDEAGDETNGSVFVSDTDDMDDRRRRARERADARRRSIEGGAEASPEGASAKPFDPATNESDEWPVF